MAKKNFMSGCIWIAFFLYFYLASGPLAASAAMWPTAVSVFGLIFSAFSVVNSLWQIWKEKTEGTTPKSSWSPFSKRQLFRSLFVVAVLVVWAWALKPIGFMVSSIAALIVIFVAFEPEKTKERIIRCSIVAVIFGAGMYAMFRALGINFPSGLLL